jgi:hypothetical protein
LINRVKRWRQVITVRGQSSRRAEPLVGGESGLTARDARHRDRSIRSRLFDESSA